MQENAVFNQYMYAPIDFFNGQDNTLKLWRKSSKSYDLNIEFLNTLRFKNELVGYWPCI